MNNTVTIHCISLRAYFGVLLLIVQIQPVFADFKSEFRDQINEFEVAPIAEKLDLLEVLLDLSVDDHPAEALQFYENSRELVDSAPLEQRLYIHEIICWAHYLGGNAPVATRICESLASEASQFGIDDVEAAAYNTLALIKQLSGRNTDALQYLDKAIAATSDASIRAAAHSNAGVLFKDSGAYDMAFERFSLAIQQSRDPSLYAEESCYYAAPAYSHIGQMNHRLGDLDTAARYYLLALECAETSKDTWDRVSSLRFLAKVHIDRNELELADQRSREAVGAAAQRSQYAVSIAATSRAEVLLQQGDLDSALIEARMAHDNADPSTTTSSRLTATIILARVLSAMDRHVEAIEIIENLEYRLRRMSASDMLEQLLEAKAHILYESGDATSAYMVSQQFAQSTRDNLNVRTLERMTLLQSLLESEKQAAEIKEAKFLQETAEARAIVTRNVSIGIVFAGLVIGYLIFARIYQARKEAEARAELEAELLQAQKLDAIGQLTGGIAHDFNNLMTVVMGATELASTGAKSRLGKADLELLRTAHDAAASGAEITHQLLAFARKQPLHPKATELANHVENSLRMFDRALGDRVCLVISVKDRPLWCKIDPAQLNTALLNLALNARDAMVSGGEIRLTCERVVAGEEHSQLIPGNDYCRLNVEDEGCGMTDRALQRAVEPFFTTKGHGSGNGLGLSMVYGFVRQSGGELFIESQLNSGTTASIWLPLCDVADSAEIHPPISIDTPQEMAEFSILVVEDDTSVRRLAVSILTRLGYTVDVASDGIEARNMLVGGYRPSAVFSDISMPGDWDGLRLARWLRDYAPEIPILLTSGYPQDEADYDGITFLGKPYNPAELSAAIQCVTNASHHTRH